MRKKQLLSIIFVLGIISVLSGMYLTDLHYKDADGFCDVTDKVSCSLVNKSSFSEVFSIPAAFLGIIWGLFLLLLTYYSHKHDKTIPLLFTWAIFGAATCLYFIYAEIQLGAICLMCTVIHIASFIILYCSYLLFKKIKRPTVREFINNARLWILWAVALVILALVYFNILR
jgi:uncharacterized membrane protein